jgi:hypothetical protein
MADKVTSFIVNSDWDMTSDHFPISITLSAEYSTVETNEAVKLDYKRANWTKFRNLLENTPVFDNSMC